MGQLWYLHKFVGISGITIEIPAMSYLLCRTYYVVSNPCHEIIGSPYTYIYTLRSNFPVL